MPMESPNSQSYPVVSLARRLHARLLERGWDLQDLARAAGISRTTVHKIVARGTRFPHRRTISRIARALEISPAELCDDPACATEETPAREASPAADDAFRPSPIDRATNPCVTELAAASPEVFAGWNPRDWNQLYSTFGTGGPLTPDGVKIAAARINRRREVTRQLEVLMETHLADVTAELIGTLHRMTRPTCNVEPAPRLDELLASLRKP